MKHNSPQLGFNNNVRHRGRVFHIQTEDSGVKKPHVITHLFADGGRILKSTKTSYAEFLEDEELTKRVRILMQEQHKAMFIALRAGKFDHMIPETPPDAAPESLSETGAQRQFAAGAANGALSVTGESLSGEAMAVAESVAAVHAPAASLPGAVIGEAADSERGTGNRPRLAFGSLSGATEFARADTVPLAVEQGPPPSPRGVREAPASGTADTMAMAAVQSARSASAQGGSARHPSIPPAGLEPMRSRLTPPPPRAAEGSTSALRALGPQPALQGGAALRAPGGVGRAPMNSSPGLVPPPQRNPAAAERPPAEPPAAERGLSGTGRLRGGIRSPSVPPPAGERISQSAAPNRPPVSASLDLDLEALERAAEQSQTPVYQQIRDLPPPPASLLKPSAPRNTSYRSVTPQATQIVNEATPRPSVAPPNSAASVREPATSAKPATQANQIPRAPTSSRGSANRYAPSRPASIFGSTRPAEGSSIFGEDLISEKSLDEVILSYLAEDLEGTAPKK